MYPAVPMPRSPQTWDDIVRLSHHEPVLRIVIGLEHRGDLTREQALIAAVFTLYNQKSELFRAEVDRRNSTLATCLVYSAEPPA
jgi:hypothetical protein